VDEEKRKAVNALGITPIDDKFKFFKQYGNQVMFYSEEYLDKMPIEDLAQKDKSNTWFFEEKLVEPLLTTAEPDPNIGRIADAAERIADALEKQNAGHKISIDGLAAKFEIARKRAQESLEKDLQEFRQDSGQNF